MTISLNKISNFFKVRKLKRKVKQLRKELDTCGDCIKNCSNWMEAYNLYEIKQLILEEISILEQQIKEFE